MTLEESFPFSGPQFPHLAVEGLSVPIAFSMNGPGTDLQPEGQDGHFLRRESKPLRAHLPAGGNPDSASVWDLVLIHLSIPGWEQGGVLSPLPTSLVPLPLLLLLLSIPIFLHCPPRQWGHLSSSLGIS